MEGKCEENGCYQKFLLDNMRGRRVLGHEGNLKMMDDLINDFMIFYKNKYKRYQK